MKRSLLCLKYTRGLYQLLSLLKTALEDGWTDRAIAMPETSRDVVVVLLDDSTFTVPVKVQFSLAVDV